MSRKNKQTHRPFAPHVKEMQKVATPVQEKHTSKHFVRHGNDEPKKTIAKPKDWSFRKPVEGRAGKATRSRQVKLTHEFWAATGLLDHLITIKAGTPDCKWTITLDNPARVPTARDILYILNECWQESPDQEVRTVEVEINHNHRVLTIIEEFASIAKTQEVELGTGVTNR